MHWKKKLGIAVLALLVSVAVLNLYFIRDDSGGYVVWNNDEAYLFIGVARRGFHTRCIGYPWAVLKEALYASPGPDDAKLTQIVIRVTGSSIEHYSFNMPDEPGIGPDLYTPLEGRIYANCPQLNGLCKWNGNRFEAASPDEQRRLDGINQLTALEIEKANGWSKRVFPGFGRQITANIGGSVSVRVKNEAQSIKEQPRYSVDVLRPAAEPERILYIDETPRMVSRSAYKHAFWER